MTIGASFFAFESAKNENQGRFERSISGFRDILLNRMTVYTNAIIYTRNLFHVQPDVSEREFDEFVSEMALRESYPGIQALGYVEFKSKGKNESAIVRYVKVMNPESLSVKGFDLAKSPERLQAMHEARDTGLPAASSRVFPMQAVDSKKMPYAFLVFVPLYKQGFPINTVQERRAAIKGFVYSGFRAPNLFGHITEDARFRRASFIVRIFDGDTLNPDALMYAEGPESIKHPLLKRDFDFHYAGHVWTVQVIAPASYSVPALRWLPGLVFALGLLLSAGFSFALKRSQSLAEQLRADILVREQTEALLSEARNEAEQANRAKSVFLANISHEIRTPLGVMLGFSEIALGQTDQKQREESLKTVIRNGHELTRIIGDVLDVSKIEAQALKIETLEFSLGEMIRDVVRIWKPQFEAKRVEFYTEVAPNLPIMILSDETRIKQVLTNLLSNALKFTKAGSVHFKVSSEPLDETRVQLKFVVADSGIGISDAQRERLFKPFSQGDSSITRKYGGSGLGLALSQAIAQTLGGSLVLAGVPTGGAEFSFTFPVAPVSVVAQEAPPKETTVSLNGRQILLVDDSPDNRALVSLMLKKAGANVDVAVDGDDGVQKALNRAYDLILMDIQMPNKDGLTAFKEMRTQHHLKVPVIALTAHALREERDRALAQGFSNYITKPVDRETLVRIASETIAAMAAATSSARPSDYELG